MTILTNPPSLLNLKFNYITHIIHSPTNHHHLTSPTKIRAAANENVTESISRRRRSILTAIVTTAGSTVLPEAKAQKWGTRSMLWERFFGSELSPEESAERLKLTAEGFHTLREMLENFTWRYVLTFIRAKKPYLSQDMKNALVLVPQALRKSYIDTANELVDNLNELDDYVRTPKIYESYLYYEKTLKSIDDLVAFLA